MTDKADKTRLDALDKRLEKAQVQKEAMSPKPKEKADSAFGQAYRIGMELVIAVVIGGFIGFLLDQWLGTAPWLMILFFFLGVAAGFLNVYKAAQKMGNHPPSEDQN